MTGKLLYGNCWRWTPSNCENCTAVTERSFGFEQSVDGLAEAAGLSTSSGLRQNHCLKEEAMRWNMNWIDHQKYVSDHWQNGSKCWTYSFLMDRRPRVIRFNRLTLAMPGYSFDVSCFHVAIGQNSHSGTPYPVIREMGLDSSLSAHLLHCTAEHVLVDWGVSKRHIVFQRIKCGWNYCGTLEETA